MLRYLRSSFFEKYIKSNLKLLLFSDKIIEKFKILLPYEEDWFYFKNYKLKKKDIILDIGAHWGESAITFSKFYPKNKILSFEPNEYVFKKLQKNTKDLNVKTYNYGISFNKISKLYFPYFRQHQLSLWGSQNLINLKKRIDKYTYLNSKDLTFKLVKCKFNKLPEIKERIGILKIDVEGNEYEVVKIAESYILRDNPLLFIEHNSSNFNKIFNLMKKIKYKAYYYLNGNLVEIKFLPHIKTILKKKRKRTTNIIFLKG